MKDFNKYTESEHLLLLLQGLSYALFVVDQDKKYFEMYKEGKIKRFRKCNKQEMKILFLLEQLGYPMDEVGTYLYKNMIFKIVETLENTKTKEDLNKCKKLIFQLKDCFSQFYVDVARCELDMGVKTFHKILEHTFEKVNYSKADQNLFNKIFGRFQDGLDYGEQAFVLGSYITENLEEKTEEVKISNNYKVKKLVNTPNDELKYNI